jgi:hypothetical protein
MCETFGMQRATAVYTLYYCFEKIFIAFSAKIEKKDSSYTFNNV